MLTDICINKKAILSHEQYACFDTEMLCERSIAHIYFYNDTHVETFFNNIHTDIFAISHKRIFTVIYKHIFLII